jgi:hypothetical protein
LFIASRKEIGGAMTATLYPYRIAVVADDITAL